MTSADIPAELVLAISAALTPGGAIAMAGNASHASQVSVLGALLATVGGAWLGDRLQCRFGRSPRGRPPSRLIHLLFLAPLGLAGAYVTAHLFSALPRVLAVLLQVAIVSGAVALARRKPSGTAAWRHRSHWTALAVGVVAIGPWWPSVGGEAAQMMRGELARRGGEMKTGSFQWVDARRLGVASVARAVALAEAGGSTDAYLARIALSHEGRPARVEGVYKTTTQLRRRPPLGARRIFEDTPVAPPNRWALLQRKRVPFEGHATGAPAHGD